MAAATNSILLKLKPKIKIKICNPLFGYPRSNSSASPSIPHLFSTTTLPYADADSDCSSEIKATADANPNFIHPSADVHPNAIIGHGVSVGPFCTIGSSVKLGNGCRLYPGSHVFGNTEIGDHCLLMPGAVVGDHLPGRTVLGCNNVIGHHAVIGVKCQDLKYKPGDECFLHIGDNNEIREHTSIHRSSKSSDKTVIGDNNLIMGSCHIAHDCNIGNNNIFANNTLLAGHVVVEDYTHTAGAIVVHQFCHIGSFSFVGGGSVVSQDVPKYTMVVGERAELRGLNLEGLRRNGFTATEEEDKELGKITAVCTMIQSLRDSFAQNRRGICKFRYFSGS
ncbi:probable acyl-[acyl-carrier-protein]--UDP-N-acetylglucosamine O-acyltransferase, mitochondrial isoform X3 [Populus trichocarpa]|uniref:probable acyl-[acyl-carrier-protein]--UDP-N-acetylglucosamine O-acyltransferase, mitochondrial isoform X3 n=1 Tax=Populus trichocarpa TaxID=3694 RepID=UPI002277EBC5|nr:probable acyl-[acyl-carrier-protein]--UDP-N-acetylglucosamine O-acyltransferase, mitochondrial isoform X3 [Populus trichocarpa]XP_052309425.1 probable acyl-[acyl-carrier-protein]--UDP-N-acetylglucosamine O-acyltransferase, mitochondrial isoform X3 [Populus trichocarpa]